MPMSAAAESRPSRGVPRGVFVGLPSEKVLCQVCVGVGVKVMVVVDVTSTGSGSGGGGVGMVTNTSTSTGLGSLMGWG